MTGVLRILIIDSDPAERNAASKAATGHTTGEGYKAALEACSPDVQVQIVCPYGGDSLPDLSQFDGVAFTGSGVDWSTEEAQAEPLRVAMRAVFAAAKPTFGSCNGMQLAATVSRRAVRSESKRAGGRLGKGHTGHGSRAFAFDARGAHVGICGAFACIAMR